jgi:hypothetical protein
MFVSRQRRAKALCVVAAVACQRERRGQPFDVNSASPTWSAQTTMMALTVASLIYTRSNHRRMAAPSGVGPVAFKLGVVQFGVQLLSLLTTVLTNHYAVRERYRPMQRWSVVATVLGLASCALRGYEFPKLVVRPIRVSDAHACEPVISTDPGTQRRQRASVIGRLRLFSG